MKIYCKRKLSKRSKKEFLHQYFDSGTPTTYFLDTDKVQCTAGRNRSIGDLKALLDGSFKTITSINKVIILLLVLLEEKKIKCLFCGTINKIVFFNKKKVYYCTYRVEELERCVNYIPNRKGWDDYCFSDLLEIYDNKNKKK